jgi:hypothetical protein
MTPFTRIITFISTFSKAITLGWRDRTAWLSAQEEPHDDIGGVEDTSSMEEGLSSCIWHI